MAISVNPLTHVIYVPKADLTLVTGTLYSINTDDFRKELKSWEDSEEGIIQLKTHNHNTEVTIAGVTYARAIEILAPYSIEFEDGTYSVRLEGSNNNIFDVENGILVQNQVQVIPTNSAGLIVVQVGSAVTEQDKLDIADRVWDEPKAGHTTPNTYGDFLDAKISTISGGGGGGSITLSGIWNYATRTLTSGIKDSEIDSILSKVTSLETSTVSILGLAGENVRWSNITHDANNLMTGARITLYDDNTLVTPVKSWDVAATYDGAGEITSYQMKEV